MILPYSTKAPKAEQQICVSCGMCCDGTLFLHASLNPGEIGNLPEEIEQNTFTEGEKDYFRLPCLYFKRKCTIYGENRAVVCGSYRCQLLKDFTERKVTLNDALSIIRKAAAMRTGVIEEYRMITDKSGSICFKQIPGELLRMLNSGPSDEKVNLKVDILLAQCNILETLLIKHLRSTGDFDKMMADSG